MEAVLLARLKFALTIGFHYLWPPLTIGLAWLIAWIKWRQWRTADPVYATMARFWIRVFGLSFVVGVATGITMEFQFGTNWAGYSRFVGDIFGAPLAAEGVFAFFLESTFLALLLFGEKHLTPRMHFLSAVMVALGATLSAFWIIVANSWQQTPAGFAVAGGRAQLTDFFSAIFNPSTLPRYLHTMIGALISGAFFMAGIAAWYLLKGRHREFARRSFRIAVVVGFVAALGQLFSGHLHAVQVAKTQPIKLAAYEGLFDGGPNAPLLLFGVPDADAARTDLAVTIPGALSTLVGFSNDTVVMGLKDFPRELWPPLGLTFFSFHLMVALGVAFIGIAALGVLLQWRKRLENSRWVLWLFVLATPLPFVANELGWIATEVGRQPWIVQGLLKTQDGISASVPAGQVLLALVLFALLYAALFGCWLFLLAKKLRQGPDQPAAHPAAALPSPAPEVRP